MRFAAVTFNAIPGKLGMGVFTVTDADVVRFSPLWERHISDETRQQWKPPFKTLELDTWEGKTVQLHTTGAARPFYLERSDDVDLFSRLSREATGLSDENRAVLSRATSERARDLVIRDAAKHRLEQLKEYRKRLREQQDSRKSDE